MTKQLQEQKQQYTVLLLSAPVGSGHRLAAEALEQLLRGKENIRVIHGNIFDFFPHILGTAFLQAYLWVLRCCPRLYELAYKWGNMGDGSLRLRNLLNSILARLGRAYLDQVQPDAVVATHATPAGIVSCYKKQHPQLWLGAVVTDFTVHRWWLCAGVNTYFVADELLREKFPGSAEVYAYGIPVRQQILRHDRDACRAAFGWQAGERVCLLMGGGEGLLPMEEIIAALHRLPHSDLRLVAVTGHNERLAARLRERYEGSIEIYAFREDVPQLLAASDMLITKAGGLTAAEALAADLELIIYKPLPGQEQGNAEFLQKHCGVQVAHNLAALQSIVQSACLTHKNAADRRQHAHPEAARKICAYILQKQEGTAHK